MAEWHRGEGPPLPTPVVEKGMRLPGVSVLAVVAQCQWWVVAQWEGTVAQWVTQCQMGGGTVGRHSGKVRGRRPLPSTVMMQGRPARCVSALSGGTVGRTVRRSRLPSGCRVQGMPPFPLQLPQTMPLASRPRQGPGGARCTGAQQLWGV